MTDDNTDTTDESTGSPIADGADEEDTEFEPMTFYLRKETQRNVKRWLKQLELDYREVEQSRKSHQYEAIVQVAMEHEEDIVQRVDEMSS